MVLNSLDFAGEKLANFFGLNSPKYAYEIQAALDEQAKREKEEEIEKENTWPMTPESQQPITKPPSHSIDLKNQ